MTGTEGIPQWQLAELAKAVGGLLGMTLDLSWDGHGVRLGVEGDGLHVHEPYDQRGRIRITGWYPGNGGYGRRGEGGPISVRADRGPRVIAAEIQRRLLPGYRTEAEKIHIYNAKQEAEEQARTRLAGLICGLFPDSATSMPSHCQSNGRSEVLLHLPSHGGGDIKFYRDGGEVFIDRFRVPAPVALRMLETVALMTSFEETSQ